MDRLNQYLEQHRDQIVTQLQGLCRIPSVEGQPLPGKPFGQACDDALNYMLNLSSSLGFKTGNVDGYAGWAEYGEGDETLGILCHLDVVPEGEGWSVPPYEAVVKDGRVYARGADDNKGPTIASLYAMKAVMESGARFTRKVRFIFGINEETGWKDMAYYAQKLPMPDLGIVPDGVFPLINTEKGVVHFSIKKAFDEDDVRACPVISISAGTVANVVPEKASATLRLDGIDQDLLRAAAKAVAQDRKLIATMKKEDGVLHLLFEGKSAHGASPDEGNNAAAGLLLCLEKVLGRDSVAAAIRLLSAQAIDTDGAGLQIKLHDDVSGDLTCNLGVLRYESGVLEAIVDIRFPITFDEEKDIRQNILSALSGCGFEVTKLHGHAPLHMPKDHPLIQTLLKVYEEQTGLEGYTVTIGGGTYARALKNAVAFGFSLPGKEGVAHQKDEYVEIDSLLLGARVYAHAIAALATDGVN